MATRFQYLKSERSALRGLIEDYARNLGPGGLLAYVASQDLVVATDLYSVMAIREASKLLVPMRLRAIGMYARQNAELPSTEMLDPKAKYDVDQKFKSLIYNKSLFMSDIVALAEAQADAGPQERLPLVKMGENSEGIVFLTTNRHNEVVHVGIRYYRNLLDNKLVQLYSGVRDSFREPTHSWRSLPVAAKGVFYRAGINIYGLVMPHAKISLPSTIHRNQD